MNSDNPCRHVRGVGCGRCLFLNHPAPVRITGQSTSNQCGNEDSDSNLYLPCDVNLEGETSSVVSEDTHDAATPRWMLPRGLKRQRLDQPPSDSSTENRIHEKRCEIRKRKPYTQSKIHPWTEQTGGLWEEEHNSPPRDGAQTVGQQTPEAPTADQPLGTTPDLRRWPSATGLVIHGPQRAAQERTGGLWEEEHNSPPRDGAQTVGQQTPEAPTADQPLDKNTDLRRWLRATTLLSGGTNPNATPKGLGQPPPLFPSRNTANPRTNS